MCHAVNSTEPNIKKKYTPYTEYYYGDRERKKESRILTHHQKPFTINTLALLQFTAHALPVVPINVYWQRWLEVRYPGFPSWNHLKSLRVTVPRWMKKKGPDDLLPRKEKSLPPPLSSSSSSSESSSSGMRNFVIKFLLDQTAGALLNITLFIVSINLLKGEGPTRIWELIGEVCFSLLSPCFCIQLGTY